MVSLRTSPMVCWSRCVPASLSTNPDAYQPHYVPIPFRTSLTISQSRFVPASLCPNPVSYQPHHVPIPFRTSLTMYQSCHLPATLCTSPVSDQPHYVLIHLTKYQSRCVSASVSINNRFVPTSLCTNPPPPPPLTMYISRFVPASLCPSSVVYQTALITPTLNVVQERRGRSFNFNAGLIWKGNIGKISGVLCLIIIGELIWFGSSSDTALRRELVFCLSAYCRVVYF